MPPILTIFNCRVNKMWVFSGCHDPSTWHTSDGISWIRNDWDTYRCYYKCLAFDNKMWIIGGKNWNPSTIGIYNDVSYSTDSTDGHSWTWTTHSANFCPRYKFVSMVYDNKMWVIGGLDGDDKYLTDAWCSSDGINWIKTTDAVGPANVSSYSGVVYDNKMWLIGGWNLAGQADAWYSTDGVQWINYSRSSPSGPHATPAVISYNNQMWVIGYTNDGTTNEVWRSGTITILK